MNNFEKQKSKQTEAKQPENKKVDYYGEVQKAIHDIRDRFVHQEFKKPDLKSLQSIAILAVLGTQIGTKTFESHQPYNVEPYTKIEERKPTKPNISVDKISIDKNYLTKNPNLRENNPDSLIVHSTMFEGEETLNPETGLGNTDRLARNFQAQITGRAKKTGFTHYVIGRESEKSGVKTYQLLPTNKASEGTMSYAKFKDDPKLEVDTHSIQVELNYNPNQKEAGEYSETISNKQLDALANIVVVNKISPSKVLAHWAVQGTHPDGDWLGFNPQEANKIQDGRINPKILRFVEATIKLVKDLPNTNENMLIKLSWHGSPELIASNIIDANLQNAKMVVAENKKNGVQDKSEIKPNELDQAIENNDLQRSGFSKALN
jgi:hypothetical protein